MLLSCFFFFITYRMMAANGGRMTNFIMKGQIFGVVFLLLSVGLFVRWFIEWKKDASRQANRSMSKTDE